MTILWYYNEGYSSGMGVNALTPHHWDPSLKPCVGMWDGQVVTR